MSLLVLAASQALCLELEWDERSPDLEAVWLREGMDTDNLCVAWLGWWTRSDEHREEGCQADIYVLLTMSGLYNPFQTPWCCWESDNLKRIYPVSTTGVNVGLLYNLHVLDFKNKNLDLSRLKKKKQKLNLFRQFAVEKLSPPPTAVWGQIMPSRCSRLTCKLQPVSWLHYLWGNCHICRGSML